MNIYIDIVRLGEHNARNTQTGDLFWGFYGFIMVSHHHLYINIFSCIYRDSWVFTHESPTNLQGFMMIYGNESEELVGSN